MTLTETERKQRHAQREHARYWSDPEKARANARIASQKYSAAHRAKVSARHRLYVAANRQRLNAQNREWRLRKEYGLTCQQYEQMLNEQGGRCRICGTDTPGGQRKYFSVDHDHDTGMVRGLLCWTCNLGLGAFGDDPEVLARAMAYLHSASASAEVA